MNLFKLLVRFLSLFAIFNVASGVYNLVWQDEFNGNSLDTSKWGYQNICDGAGNNELECYTSRTNNVYVSNGNLYIKAIPENYGGKPFTSGRISTSGLASWKYGSVQARIMLPDGLYLWPAFWMMPEYNSYGVWWPQSGEIDIMENHGGQNSEHSSTLHYGGGYPNNIYTSSNSIYESFDLTRDYHIYGVNWTSTNMDFFVDNKIHFSMPLTRSFNNAAAGSNPYNANGQPFDQNFHIILNLATGGNFFGGNSQSLNWATANGWRSPQLVVDWVRVYQDDGTSPAPAQQSTSYNNQCGSGLLSVNGQCYQPSSCCVNGAAVTVNQCTTSGGNTPAPAPTPQPTGNTQPVQGNCPPPLMSCSGQCFLPSQNDCVLSSNGSYQLCPKGFQACDKACYSPNNYKCVNNQLQAK